MPTFLRASRLRLLMAFYLSMVALLTLLFAVRSARAAHPWIMGEWLINYSGGFLRRGLPGECLLRVQHLSGLPLLGLASALQVGLYTAFYASLPRLLRGLRWSLPLLALLLSPATLSFTVLDPPSSARKEILLFVALSLLVNAAIFCRPRLRTFALALAVMAPLLVLAHEALLAFLPWLAVPLLLEERRRGRQLWLLLPMVLTTAVAFAAVLLHPGTRAQVQAVCRSVHGSLDPAAHGLCSGSIAYLERTPAEAHADATRAAHFYHYATRYTVPLLLAVAPVVLILWRRLHETDERRRRSAQVILSAGAFAVLLSLPLFFYARDWGRWIEIHVTCALLLLLLVERGHGGEETPLQLPSSAARRGAALLGLALYSLCWTLPAVGIFPGRFGYVDLLRYLQQYETRPHPTPSSDQP